MGILDIVVIVVALIFIIWSAFKGFAKTIFGALGGVLSLVAAYFLCGIVAGWLLGSGWGTSVTNSIMKWFEAKDPLFAVESAEITNEMLTAALSKLGIPGFLHGIIIGVLPMGEIQNMSIAAYLAPHIAKMAFTGGSYLVIFIVVRIVCFILCKLFTNGVKHAGLGFVDHLLGVAWGAVKAAFVIYGVFFIVSMLVSLPALEGLNTWITNDMESKVGIAKFLYTNNPLVILIGKIFPNK